MPAGKSKSAKICTLGGNAAVLEVSREGRKLMKFSKVAAERAFFAHFVAKESNRRRDEKEPAGCRRCDGGGARACQWVKKGRSRVAPLRERRGETAGSQHATMGGGEGPGTGGFDGSTGRRCRGRRRPGGRGLRGSTECVGGRAWPGGSGQWGGGRPV